MILARISKRVRNCSLLRQHHARVGDESRSVINTARNAKCDWFANKCLPQIPRSRFFNSLLATRNMSSDADHKYLAPFLIFMTFKWCFSSFDSAFLALPRDWQWRSRRVRRFHFDLSPFDEISPSNKFRDVVLRPRIISTHLRTLKFRHISSASEQTTTILKIGLFIHLSAFVKFRLRSTRTRERIFQFLTSKLTFNMQLNNRRNDLMCEHIIAVAAQECRKPLIDVLMTFVNISWKN